MGNVLLRRPSPTIMGRRSKECFHIGISVVLSSLLCLQSLVTAPLLLHTAGAVTATGRQETEDIRYFLLHPYGDPALLSEAGESDRQQKLRIGAAEQGINDVRRLISRSFPIVTLSVTGIRVLGSIRQSISTRKVRYGSLLALSIGGHAPPEPSS